MSAGRQNNVAESPVILSPSAAAREATREDATPGALGKKYGAASSSTYGHVRAGSSSSLSKDTNDVPDDYFEAGNKRPRLATRPHSSQLGPGLASSVTPQADSSEDTIEFLAGFVQKPFRIHSDLLIQKSPYFAALTTASESSQIAKELGGPFIFPELDEFAFSLFVRWMYTAELQGPHDFHSMNHYLCLYILAHRFGIESLKNDVMDLVRRYYRRQCMTAPAFRLEYLYDNTDGPCPMRKFLVTTAAYRALSVGEKPGGITDSVKGVLKKGGDVAVDFAVALCDLAKNEREDVRKGDDCRWHEHDGTTKCSTWAGFEPFETP